MRHLWYDEQVVVFSVPWHLNLQSRWTIELDHPICVTVWGCECVGLCDCAVKPMCVYSLALLCVKKCLLFALSFTFTPFDSRESIYPQIQYQRIKGRKLVILGGCSAETRLTLSYRKDDNCFDLRPGRKETIQIYLWSHLIQFSKSVSWERNREADRQRKLRWWPSAFIKELFSEPLTTLPRLPRQHTDLQEPTQRHTAISPRFGWCV